MRVLSIDAWCDGQNCIECGSSKLSDTTKGKKVKCDCCLTEFDEREGKTWTWNNWFHVADYKGELNEQAAMKYFEEELFTGNLVDNDKFLDIFEVIDDQYNLVLIRKKDQMPIYAIEYGGQV